jgi:hypothetical protein
LGRKIKHHGAEPTSNINYDPFKEHVKCQEKLPIITSRYQIGNDCVVMNGVPSESENSGEWQVTQITGDLRKFSEYVLVPNHKSGKDRIFIGRLGFRPNSLTDAEELLAAYISQAIVKFAAKEYIVGEADSYGQRFTIIVEIRGKRLFTGWILDDQGILKLATPFSGFAPGGN